MRSFSIFLLSVSSLFTLTCCRPKNVTGAGLEQYLQVASNGLSKVEQRKDLQVRVTYQPASLLALHELAAQPDSAGKQAEVEKRYAQSTYFLLELARNGKGVLRPEEGFSEYSSLLQTLAFQMQDRMELVTAANDTLRPTNYLLDRTYGPDASTRLLFAFPKTDSPVLKVTLQEFGLGTGNMAFPFQEKDIQAVPALYIAR